MILRAIRNVACVAFGVAFVWLMIIQGQDPEPRWIDVKAPATYEDCPPGTQWVSGGSFGPKIPDATVWECSGPWCHGACIRRDR